MVKKFHFLSLSLLFVLISGSINSQENNYDPILSLTEKSTNAAAVKLDSTNSYSFLSDTDSVLSEKKLYFYKDTLQICTHTLTFNTDNLQWENSIIDSNFFDNNRHLSKYQSYNWLTDENRWESNMLIEYSNSIDTSFSIVKIWDINTNDWVNNYKSIYVRDAVTQHIISAESYNYDAGTGQWKGAHKNDYLNINDSIQLVKTRYSWNNTSFTWDTKTDIYYNESNVDTLSVTLKWNSTINEWEKKSKTYTEHSSDGNNNFREYTFYFWETENSSWQPVYKRKSFVYSWSTEIEYSFWANSSEWQLDNKSEISYNQNGKIDTILTLQYNYSTDSWDTSKMSFYGYSNDGVWNYIEGYYNYDIETNRWGNGYKNFIDKSSDNYHAEDYMLDTANGEWIGSNKQTTIYGNPIISASYFWDIISNDWLLAYKQDVYRDDNLTQLIVMYQWDTELDQEVVFKKTLYYYSDYVIDEETSAKLIQKDNLFNIYPNPVANDLFINSKTNNTVSIISATGSTMYKSNINSGEHRIDMSHFSSGVYFILVESEDGYSETKTILKK